MSKSIIVLSQPNCRPCGFVKNWLNNNDVKYEEINVQEKGEYIEKYNIMSTPVVLLMDDSGNEVERVSGFNPSQLEEMIEQL